MNDITAIKCPDTTIIDLDEMSMKDLIFAQGTFKLSYTATFNAKSFDSIGLNSSRSRITDTSSLLSRMYQQMLYATVYAYEETIDNITSESKVLPIIVRPYIVTYDGSANNHYLHNSNYGYRIGFRLYNISDESVTMHSFKGIRIYGAYDYAFYADKSYVK